MAAPVYVLTQELLDDLRAMLAQTQQVRAQVTALQSPAPPRPRDMWGLLSSATTQEITIEQNARAGYYPGTWHYRDEAGNAFSTGVECWIRDVNGATLETGVYYRAFCAYADDAGKPIFYVMRDKPGGTTATVEITEDEPTYEIPADTIFIEADDDWNVTIIDGSVGDTNVIINTGPGTVTFPGVLDPDGNDLVLEPGKSANIAWDPVNSGWIVIGGTVVTGGTDVNGCRVTDSDGQTVNNGNTDSINWDTETADDGGYHDNATNNTRLTVPSGKGGWHTFGAYLNVAGTPSSGHGAAVIRLNGTTTLCQVRSASNDTNGTHLYVLNGIYKLSATDYIEVRFANSFDVSMAVQTDSCFYIHRLDG